MKSISFFFQIPFSSVSVYQNSLFSIFHHQHVASPCFSHALQIHKWSQSVRKHLQSTSRKQNLHRSVSPDAEKLQVTSSAFRTATLTYTDCLGRGGSVCKAKHGWSNTLANPLEGSPQIKAFLFRVKTEFQSNNGRFCDISSWTLIPQLSKALEVWVASSWAYFMRN